MLSRAFRVELMNSVEVKTSILICSCETVTYRNFTGRGVDLNEFDWSEDFYFCSNRVG